MKRTLQALAATATTLLLSGCLLISPNHDGVLSSQTAEIPFQAWTSKTGGSLIVDCMPTNRGGPSTSHGDWRNITSIPISTQSSLDIYGTSMYSAAKDVRLVSSCWWLNRSNSNYYTTIRVTQQDYYGEDRFNFHTLDRAGVSCVGESVGRTGSWVSWLNDGCVERNRAGQSIRYVTLRTRNRFR